MADYTYRIHAAGTNSGFSWTSLQDAWDNFKNNNIAGGGTGVLPAASNLYFQIDGYLDFSNVTMTLQGITCSNNTTSLIYVESYSNAWNSAAREIRKYTSYDGFQCNGGYVNLSGATQGNVTFRNFVINGGASSTATMHINAVSSSQPCTIDGVLVVLSHGRTGMTGINAGYDVTVKNTVVLVYGTDPVTPTGIFGGNSTVYVDNCTVICLDSISGSVGIQGHGGAGLRVRNTYVGGFATDYTGTFAASGHVGNASSGTATPENNTGLESIALSTTNFENVTTSTEDLRVKSTSALATTGAARLATVLTDVFGVSRQDPTTVGAFEALAGGGSSTTPLKRKLLLGVG